LAINSSDKEPPLLPDRYHLYVDDKLYSVHRSQAAADVNLATVGKTFPNAKVELRIIKPGHQDYHIKYAFHARKTTKWGDNG
jgi:hypothetical protein